MKNIMGLVDFYTKYAKQISQIILLFLFICDAYLIGLVYGPESFITTAKAWEKKIAMMTSKVAIPNILPHTSNTPSPSITSEPSTSAIPSQTPQPSPSSTPNPSSPSSPVPSATSTPSNSPTPTPTATTTPTPAPTSTPTPTPTPTATPTPTPVASPVTSSVYIHAHFYENGQEYDAQQYPVKVINSQTNETLYTAEIGQDGNSPTWQVQANTPISIYLYPKSGTTACGDVWSLTIGTLGTMETHNLSVQAGRNPCIKE